MAAGSVWRRADTYAARRWTQLFLLLTLAALTVASSRYYPHQVKRNDQTRPFVLGSRYGRSGEPPPPPSPPLSIAPRNDRFFMGSRYGKRSAAAVEAEGGRQARGAGGAGEEAPAVLACRYTGLYQLYRCTAPPSPPAPAPLALRSNDASSISDEILADDFKDLD